MSMHFFFTVAVLHVPYASESMPAPSYQYKIYF